MTMSAHIVAPKPIADHLHTPENLAAMLALAAEQAPDRDAIVCTDDRLSYGALIQRLAHLSRILSAIIQKGEMIAVIAPNSAACVTALLASVVTGARVVPLNPFYPRQDLANLFIEKPALILSIASSRMAGQDLSDDLGGVGHICLEDIDFNSVEPFETALAEIKALAGRIEANDPALLIFTGGTTGRSKAVEHSHRALIHSIKQHSTVWKLRYDLERILNVAPLFHIWAFGFAMLAPLYLRGTLVLLERYVPENVLRAIGEHGVTVFAGGPAPIYYGLLNSPELDQTDFTTLQIALTGGASCPQPLKDAWYKAAQSQLLEGWGMSEGAPLCLNWRDDQTPNLSVGRPVPDTEIQIVDTEDENRVLSRNETGEVRVKGPQLMTAYRLQSGEPDLSMRNGWLYTGDIGFINDDGYLSLVDRKKDVIIVGGYNVYPREVEDSLRAHPDILDIAVVGQKDDYLGETPVAFVITKSNLDEATLQDFCKARFVKYKRPVRFIKLDEFPRTGPGKINKIALRQMLRA